MVDTIEKYRIDGKLLSWRSVPRAVNINTAGLDNEDQTIRKVLYRELLQI